MVDYLSICEQAARAGGDALRHWEGRYQVREKGPADLVTEADLASQEAVRQVIARHCPDDDFVAEEGSAAKRSGANICWIVDPLDGTANYVHDVPHYCVSVAVLVGRQIAAGAVYQPTNNECYTVSAGQGAFRNGRPIHTSHVSQVGQALLAVSFPPRVRRDSKEIASFLALVEPAQAVRRTGSAALNLCYVADGRFDGYFTCSDHPWDVAAGVLMVREAGGLVTSPDGSPFDIWNPRLVAACGRSLHEQMVRCLAG